MERRGGLDERWRGKEGNMDNDFFELIQGAVIVVKGGKKIAEITQPGAYFGEMAAISGAIYIAVGCFRFRLLWIT